MCWLAACRPGVGQGLVMATRAWWPAALVRVVSAGRLVCLCSPEGWYGDKVRPGVKRLRTRNGDKARFEDMPVMAYARGIQQLLILVLGYN